MKRKTPFRAGCGEHEGHCENRAGTAGGGAWRKHCSELYREACDRVLQEFIRSFEKADEYVHISVEGAGDKPRSRP